MAGTVFAETYPSIFDHFRLHRESLERRQDKGRFWWELRSCSYWAEFDKPKIMYPEITWRASWGLDLNATVCNNTAYFIATVDRWVWLWRTRQLSGGFLGEQRSTERTRLSASLGTLSGICPFRNRATSSAEQPSNM